MAQREARVLDTGQEREIGRLRGKAERVKLVTLREAMNAMSSGYGGISFLSGFPQVQQSLGEDLHSPLASSALSALEDVLRIRIDQDEKLLRDVAKDQEYMEEERGGAVYRRLGTEVEDGILTENFSITHRGRKPRLVSLKLAPGELSNHDLTGALECVYSILLGTDSGQQVLDARSTVKVQEIIANEKAPLRLKGIALYSNFDHTLYNIDWSEDPRILSIDIEPFLYRKDRIKHYEGEMARLFEREIQGY